MMLLFPCSFLLLWSWSQHSLKIDTFIPEHRMPHPTNRNLNILNHANFISHTFQMIFTLKFLYNRAFISIMYMPVWCYLSNVHMIFLKKVVHVVGMYTEDLQLAQVIPSLTLNAHCTSHRFLFLFLCVWVDNETNQY